MKKFKLNARSFFRSQVIRILRDLGIWIFFALGVIGLPAYAATYATATFTNQDNPEHEIDTLINSANIDIQNNHYESALVALTRASTLSHLLKNSRTTRLILNSMANVYYQTEQFDKAGRYYEQLVSLYENDKDHKSLADSLYNLAHVYASQKNNEDSELLLQRSLLLSKELNDETGIAFTLKALGVNFHAQGDLERAAEYFEKALLGFQQTFNQEQVAIMHRHLGDLLSANNQFEFAVNHYELALPILAQYSFDSALQTTYRGLSQAYENLQDYNKAFVTYRAYAQLSMLEQQQQSQETMQRLQVEFETQQFSDENERLALQTKTQEQELAYRTTILKMQFLVLCLVLTISIVLAIFWWRSRNYGKKMQELATIDELTGLFNRRAIMQFGNREWQRSKRFQRPFSCLIFDIDHFKQVNDNKGHSAGDAVLKAISTAVKSTLRETDVLGRIGGEEFLLFSTETDTKQAEFLAERIRKKVEGLHHKVMGEERITISIGIAHLNREASLDELIQNADKALYDAKETGRNKVVLFDLSQETQKPEFREVKLSLNSALTIEPV